MDTIINSMVGWIPTFVIDPIRVRFRILRNLRENIGELKKTAEKLDGRRKDQRRRLEAAKKEKLEASAEATRWFCQVDGDLSNANNLQTEYDQGGTGPFSNCFLFWSDYRLSKRALKLKQDADRLYEEELKSGWTVDATVVLKGRRLDTVNIEGQPRTEELLHEIFTSVLDDRYVVVGLYGMGGVGKTTLLRLANEHFRKMDDFESVIFTTISATPNFVEIRKQIANSLGLVLDKDLSDENLKDKLSELVEKMKYLLILDDMWEPVIDLGEIICSIPAPNKENGCKILIASRSKSVATRFVIRFAARDSLQSIRVNSLAPDEAWNLFVQKVGTALTSKPEINPLAKEVLRKCGGLPLAIIVIGGTMSMRETEGEWKDAVRELEQSASNLEGIEEEVFPILMFSFEKLEQIEQSLFLYCCLFPEDFHIGKELLYDLAFGEETLCGMHKLEDIRNKVDVLVGKLRNSSMIEDAGDGRIKMHDVMRELGMWITSHTISNNYQYSCKYIAKASAKITEAPDALEWCKATKISLMWNNEIKSLPQLPDQCPQLHTLLLQKCTSIKNIPPLHFLEHMPALQILDLRETLIIDLPPSISHLINLRFLCLSGCKYLQQLPAEIGMLDQLIFLDLSCCNSLREVPVEMKRLNNLRRLDIRSNLRFKRIPDGVLSGLHKLEELTAKGGGLVLYTNGIMELSQLTRLTSFSIPGVEIKKVKVSHWLKLIAKGIDGHLHLGNCSIDDSLAILDLLEDSPDFGRFVIFNSCEGLTCVPTHGCRSLTVRGCPDLKTLLLVKELERNAFEHLYELVLDQLEQLETICNGVPQHGCFSNLEYIKIQACPNLKVLFTTGVTRLLRRLERLHVYRCPQLEKLLESNKYMETDAFPSLEEICLCELPELTAICHRDLKWPSLSTAHVYLCPKLRRPPFGARLADILLHDEIDSWKTINYLDEKRKEVEPGCEKMPIPQLHFPMYVEEHYQEEERKEREKREEEEKDDNDNDIEEEEGLC